MASSTPIPRGSFWQRLTGLNAYAPDAPDRGRSLVAASLDLRNKRVQRSNIAAEGWQQEAIELYSEVGELRYVANAQANAASRARMFVGQWTADSSEPVEVEDDRIRQVFDLLGGGDLNRAEMVKRLYIQLFVPGDGYLIGLPPGVLDDSEPEPAALLGMEDLSWHVMSSTEVTITRDEIKIDMGDRIRKARRDEVVAIRIWRPNPFRWWQADSPVRSNLPILREIVGLTKHVSASIDSRLAGAGVLLIGDSFSLLAGQSPDPDDTGEVDPVMAALMDAMLTAIRDRDSASAIMPIVLQGPDEAVDKVQHLTFSTPFDAQAKDLRDEAVRRLALGLEAPPEVLLGLGQSTHWNAWIITDDNVKTHIDPALAMICEAFTADYLWPMLEEIGVPDPRSYTVWWDSSVLTMRPDRSDEAVLLYDRGELSGEALRRETGFAEEDAGDVDNRRVVETAIEFAKANPELLASPGLGALIDVLREAMSGGPVPTVEVPVVDEPVAEESPTQPTPDAGDGLPDTLGDEEPPGEPAS